jgi:hypothetical protein
MYHRRLNRSSLGVVYDMQYEVPIEPPSHEYGWILGIMVSSRPCEIRRLVGDSTASSRLARVFLPLIPEYPTRTILVLRLTHFSFLAQIRQLSQE